MFDPKTSTVLQSPPPGWFALDVVAEAAVAAVDALAVDAVFGTPTEQSAIASVHTMFDTPSDTYLMLGLDDRVRSRSEHCI
jgi:hypothetical protein